ncbi:MAG: helix-turn-helix domain-containing protein [Patescibacteria group bacterium]
MSKNDEATLATLTSFGLSKNEAGVYMAILEIGRGTVAQISRRAGINRTTGYDILDRLSSDGLVRISGKEPKQEYVAESPERLHQLLSNKMRALEESMQKAKTFVPQLTSIHKVESRPTVKFYEGIEGLKEVYEDTLTSTEEIVAYARYEEMHAALGSYFPSYYERRAKKGIVARGIVADTPMTRERMTHNKDEARIAAVVPQDKFDITPDIEIYDNKVMIASWKDKLGIIIESAEIAQAMKQIFALAWEEAKRLDVLTK